MDKSDYSRIGAGDTLETIGLESLIHGNLDAKLRARVTTRTGEVFEIPVKHTLSEDQLKWLQAGSALNHIRASIH